MTRYGSDSNNPFAEDLLKEHNPYYRDYTIKDNKYDEDEFRYLHSEIKNVQSDTLRSTRNIVRTINSTKESANETLLKLEGQKEQLDNAEKNALSAKYNTSISKLEAKEVKKYSKLFNISLPKIFKRTSKEEKDIIKARSDVNEFGINKTLEKSKKQPKHVVRKETSELQEKMEHLSSTSMFGGRLADDDFNAKEKEIDDNLNYVSKHLAELKMMGLEMTSSLDAQSKQIDRIACKADEVDNDMVDTMGILKRYE
ncbi:hypothetical protein ROZALSC1DRAFT_30113 [Rozella allomycis CSF55]|uniref:t-SNARE coiled-coil homology domain-containing protein n=1 Tax=Rozella allomycis (strain CSF55) TaxID=988480 RepID=A0A075B4V1_ROZAC|nr:hypothetical protein O9G_005377 [Rozella allomycis CSF55]RKP18167.1 hypothetical protein ROZALSC1DRAFT_30113 [Rozella allomycis CSF55]|eukprot:EPZ36505.1 hypothetical protein O9G_005377 [Rozella allomycis CSF55]